MLDSRRHSALHSVRISTRCKPKHATILYALIHTCSTRSPVNARQCVLDRQQYLCRNTFGGTMRSTCPPQTFTHSTSCGRVTHQLPRERTKHAICHMAAVHSHVLISTYTDAAGELMRAATFSRLVSDPDPSNQPVDLGTSTSSGRAAGQAEVIQFPKRSESEAGPKKDPPLVRVRLSVNYRVHSRQILCIGGSQIPFGWSFLSIAKVPMVWNQGDIWTAEVT